MQDIWKPKKKKIRRKQNYFLENGYSKSDVQLRKLVKKVNRFKNYLVF